MMVPMAFHRAETVAETAQAFVARFLGAEGKAWLAHLPTALEDIAGRWKLEVGRPLRGGLMSAVYLVTRADGSPAVLKIGGPWSPTRHEATALRVWRNAQTPELFSADIERQALLLELIEPGTKGADAKAGDVASVLRSLHAPAPSGLPSLRDLVEKRLETARRSGRPEQKLDWALTKMVELELVPPQPMLVHGDFDERNLLWSRGGLVAIDPWPCVGDPAYDAGYWVHGNRRPGRRARLDALVELGFDRARVRDWAAIVGVHG